jgi:uncharacterized membrane protein
MNQRPVLSTALTNVLCLAAILWGVAFGVYNTLQLPDRVPVHFGLDGTPDRFGNRLEAGFGLLVVILAALLVNLIVVWLLRTDTKAQAQESILNLARAGTTLVMVVLQFVIVGSYHSARFDGKIVMIALGVLFVVLGNVMPKTQPNPFAGVRLPYTHASKRAWRAANRAGGWLFVALGAALILFGALLPVQDALRMMLFLPVVSLTGVAWLWWIAKHEYEADPERQPLG